MAFASTPGGSRMLLGPMVASLNGAQSTNANVDALEKALCFFGQVQTSDNAAHTINTSGASSIQFRTGSSTIVDGTTQARVGIGNVDLAAGPPARPPMVGNIMTALASKTFLTSAGWPNSTWATIVPDTGSMLITPGDMVAVFVQMLVRGGTDTLALTGLSAGGSPFGPQGTTYTAPSTFAAMTLIPNIIISFADGALGYIDYGDVFSSIQNRAVTNVSTPREYGQLFVMPFPMRIKGIYGSITAAGDFTLSLYTDPLTATPLVQRSIAVDGNTITSAVNRWGFKSVPPLDVPANTPIVAAMKSTTASSVSVTTKTYANSAHGISDPTGLTGYAVSRGASGAFVDAQPTGLEQLYMGLVVEGFDTGAGGGGGGGGSYHDRLGL